MNIAIVNTIHKTRFIIKKANKNPYQISREIKGYLIDSSIYKKMAKALCGDKKCYCGVVNDPFFDKIKTDKNEIYFIFNGNWSDFIDNHNYQRINNIKYSIGSNPELEKSSCKYPSDDIKPDHFGGKSS